MIRGTIFFIIFATFFAALEAGTLNAGYPLHELAAQGNIAEMVDLIRNCHANPNVQDERGRTPLHCAVAAGDDCGVAFFLFIVPDTFDVSVDLTLRNNDGQTAEELARVLYGGKDDIRSRVILKHFEEACAGLRVRGFLHVQRSDRAVRVVDAFVSELPRPRVFLPIIDPDRHDERCRLSPRACGMLATCGILAVLAFVVWFVGDGGQSFRV